MVRIDALRGATEEFLSAALIGDTFEPALTQLADAAGASATVLSVDDGVSIKDAVCTASIAEGVAKYLAGKCPPNPRTTRCTPSLVEGFRTDHDDFTQEEMARSPWYQEFLRDHGFFWNATGTILKGRWGEGVYVSFKRPWEAGPFEASELGPVGSALAELRRAAQLGQRTRDFETLGMVRLVHERGDPVFELDRWGRVLRVHAFDHGAVSSVSVARGRLRTAEPLAQPALDRAIATALPPSGRSAVARAPARAGETHYLLVIPVLGRARDIFLSAFAIAALISGRSRRTPLRIEASSLRDLFGLTEREAALAFRLGDGTSLNGAAQALNMSVGTARNHLKSVFEKTGVQRQSGLVALLGALRP